MQCTGMQQCIQQNGYACAKDSPGQAEHVQHHAAHYGKDRATREGARHRIRGAEEESRAPQQARGAGYGGDAMATSDEEQYRHTRKISK